MKKAHISYREEGDCLVSRRPDYNYQAYIKLTEKFITTQILQKNIITFLQNNIQLEAKETIIGLLEKYSGKSKNTIYKNINQLQVYSTPSFIRYWQSLSVICKKHGVSEEKIPILNEVYLEYEDFFALLSYISLEDKLENVLQTHTSSTLELINFYSSKSELLTDKQNSLLAQIKGSQIIIDALEANRAKARGEQKERMKKVNERT
ncbi:hypothetical protein ACQKP0_15905 [Heyndrickxia sp. NPDC080065]|uniref:hypothetical protein n=1 Tax=Heyndrickxia sp. NPDC080065 TaxID=3390568 RepID=UPI003D087FBE